MPSLMRSVRAVHLLPALLVAALLSGCSIPSLEAPGCADARDGVKQFYSYHFGNDMHPSAENLKARERFLTPELFRELSSMAPTSLDYFTAAETPPKTFKIAQCTLESEEKVDVHVQVYWREEDSKVTQKVVHVEALKVGGSWLVNKVSN